MNAIRTKRALPRAAGIAAIALFGLTTSVHAEQGDAATPKPVGSETVGAVQFADAFAPFALPEAPVAQAHAVDITTIAPPAPAADRAAASPSADPARSLGGGVASYYADRFNGLRTASGERFNQQELTAAHRTLPFGTRVLVTNPANGRSVVVRINDRGPFVRGREIDLSRAAAEQVGIVRAGHGRVELALLQR